MHATRGPSSSPNDLGSEPMFVTRRTVVAAVVCATLLHRTAVSADVPWRFVRQDMENFYKPLPRAVVLADCEWLRTQVTQAEKRMAALGSVDVARFKAYVQRERPKMQAAIKALDQAIKANNAEFDIQTINTVVGCVLSILGLLVLPEFAVGGLIAAQLISVVGFSAWSLVENPNSGAKVLMGYTRDKSLTLVGIVADQSIKLGARLLSRGLAVLGPLISAQEALEARGNGKAASAKLNAMLVELRNFDSAVAGLPMNDDKKLLDEVLKPIYSSSASALKAFIKDTEKNNCQIPLGATITRP